MNGDGKRSTNEPGLAGWTIYIDLNNNRIFDLDENGKPLEPSTITSADNPLTEVDEAGRYVFEDLQLGRYTVAEVVQAGWVQTFPTPQSRFGFEDLKLNMRVPVGRSVEIQSTDDYLARFTAQEFFFLTGGSTNQGIAQVENNGQAGDAGLELQVNNINLRFEFTSTLRQLSIKFGEFGGNVNLAVNGDLRNVANFSDLNGLTIGGALIVVTPIAGTPFGLLEVIGEINSFTIGGQELFIDALTVERQGFGVHVVDVRGDVTNRDFGNRRLAGGISGVKWNDEDGDGQFDEGENGLAGWTIYVDINNNRQLDKGEPFDVTGERGEYFIEGVSPGEYTVVEVQQEGWRQTFPVIAAATFRFEDLPAQQEYQVGDEFSAIGTAGAIASATASEFFFLRRHAVL